MGVGIGEKREAEMENGSRETVRIVVAAHKSYPMPKDAMYLPLHVGAEGKTDAAGRPLSIGFQKDNTGENISALNAGFCELTGLYWAWKHLTADWIGLVHYRRHFAAPLNISGAWMRAGAKRRVLKEAELQPLLTAYDVFVPKRRIYGIETLYSHYAHTHYAGHLDLTRKLVEELCPSYLPDFDVVMKRTWGYMFNMMILKRGDLDRYCEWLFPLLFRLQECLEATGETAALSAYQGRLYGRVSELLFNVWLAHEIRVGGLTETRICELPLYETEPVNWVKKGSAFLKARFLKKRYEGSF